MDLRFSLPGFVFEGQLRRSKLPTAGFIPWSSAGYCHCCRRETTFTAKTPWLRDNYLCDTCQSIPRQRHIQMVLDTYFKGWESKRIHESSPAAGFIPQYCANYTQSQLFSDVPLGDMFKGSRCENLEGMTFDDGTFDIFITQDVMEHVFRPDLAIAEIHRVLQPGGIHIFTAPKHTGTSERHPAIVKTRQRAKMRADGSVDHLMPPNYHGSPVGDGRALVTWDYGSDFESLLSEWSGASVCVFQTTNRSLGIDAHFNEVFVMQKAA